MFGPLVFYSSLYSSVVRFSLPSSPCSPLLTDHSLCRFLIHSLTRVDTPWDEPTQNSAEFSAFVDGSLLEMDPWNRIKGGALDTLLRMLELDPKKRVRVRELEALDWVNQYV